MKYKFEKLTANIESYGLPVHGVQLYQGGELLGEWGNCSERFPVYSITKSILSLAVGIAEQEGLIKLEDSVLKYIPDSYIQKLSWEQQQIFSRVSIHRLLTMSFKGFEFRPEGDDWLLFSLNSKINPDKREFHYTNICAYLTGVALESAVKIPLQEYLQQKIFSPLEIDQPEFAVSPEGFFNGASGIKLNVAELSKIGNLIIDNGIYKKQIIVPADYIHRATSIQIENREGGYGYFIWKYLNGFSLNGKWGQKCYCIPEDKIVLSVLSNFIETSDFLKNEVLKFFTT